MRPIELTLRGFRSYADDTTFDFTGRNLVGIVGPIGSGKSSILDAVSFALYGKTPRIAGETKTLINQRKDSLHVSLSFEVDGTVWKATRALRRNGAAAHTLYRVEDGEDHPIADKARDMGEKIEEILGLDFEAFRRSVLLAQNQFAGFLEATGTDRNKVLKGVFGFDRLDAMRQAVKARVDKLGGRMQVLADRRETAESDRKELAEKKKTLVGTDERARTLEALRGSVNQVDEVLRGAEDKRAAAATRLAALDALAGSIPDRESTEGLFRASTDADTTLTAAVGALSAAEEMAVEALSQLEAAIEAVGGRQALESAADQVARHRAAGVRAEAEAKRLAEVREAVTVAEKGRDASEAALVEALEAENVAAAAVEKADEDERAARDALHAAHTADRAHSLRSELAAGEPCPVCDQLVAKVPPKRAAAKVDAAEKAAAKATAFAAKVREARAAAHSLVAQREAARDAAIDRVTQSLAAVEQAEVATQTAVGSVTELGAVLEALLGKGDPEERLAAHRAAVSSAEKSLEAARSAEAAARKKSEEARGARDAAGKAVERLRTGLANLAGRLGAEIDIGETAAEVEAGLKAVRSHWLDAHAGADGEREQASNEAEAAHKARVELLEGAGLAAKDDIMEVAAEAAKEATALGATVAHLEKRLAEMDALAGEEADLVAQAGLLDRLLTDLLPSGFLVFVLDERRHDLADLAGAHLETLTASRYRFSDDGDFNMVDLAAADSVRAPSSLSGGETFLASLALALALAEIVAREGGRLDAFFLDEGFGSLDVEHLDLAMRGIERLVATETDRLVVLVSHVPAMREWIEDLIVLDRDGLTGATRVVEGASR
ncbi:MAG: SMC family ATPase [Acidimicrobiia bacterium]